MGFNPFTQVGGSSGPANPNRRVVPLFSPAEGVELTSGGATNAQGAAWTALGTAGQNHQGLLLYIGESGGNANRFGLELSFDNATVKHPEFPIQLGSAYQHSEPVHIPLQVPSGTVVYGRIRCSIASQKLSIHTGGLIDPNLLGYTTATALVAFDTAATRPSAVNVAPQTVASGATAFTTIIDPTAAAYGAVLVSLGENGVAPTASQRGSMLVGLGAANTEQIIGMRNLRPNTSTPYLPRGNLLVPAAIPAGSRLSVNACFPNAEPTAQYRVHAVGYS